MYTRAVDKKKNHFVLEILINTCKQAVKRQSHLSALEKKEKKRKKYPHIQSCYTNYAYQGILVHIRQARGKQKKEAGI